MPDVITGAEVAALRKRKSMSLSEFAKWLGVHRRTVSKWESGERAVGSVASKVMREESDRLSIGRKSQVVKGVKKQ